jgi:hypothetical protein
MAVWQDPFSCGPCRSRASIDAAACGISDAAACGISLFFPGEDFGFEALASTDPTVEA